jgi:hypothetical protein
LSSYDTAQTAINSTQATTNTGFASDISTANDNIAINTTTLEGLAVGSVLFTTDDVFVEKAYGVNMPTPANATTDMSFQIDGEDYRVLQGTYNGIYSNGVQTNAHTVQNLFINNGTWYYMGGNNGNFTDINGDIISIPKAYDTTTGLYTGTYHPTIVADSVSYVGDFLEFHNPFYFKISSLTWTAEALTSIPLKSWLLGSNDGVEYTLIKEMLNDDSNLTVTHTIDDTNKYKILRFVVSEITPNNFGYRLGGLSFAGSAYNSLIVSTADQLMPLIADISTNAAAISTNSSAQATVNTTLQTNIDAIDLSGIATNAAAISTNSSAQATVNTTLQSNIDNIQTKTEDVSALTFTSNTILTHTYDEINLFVEPTTNDVFTLNLTITSPQDGKIYNQTIDVNAQEYKGYVNVLNVNGSDVEIKHLDGESINLAPIAGYSMLSQKIKLIRMGGVWYSTSEVGLYYNSASNRIYDVTPPVITIIGDSVVNHEINTTYTDGGATAEDDKAGTITGDMTTVSTVNSNVIGAYSVTYTVSDTEFTTVVVRVVNVVDSTGSKR